MRRRAPADVSPLTPALTTRYRSPSSRSWLEATRVGLRRIEAQSRREAGTDKYNSRRGSGRAGAAAVSGRVAATEIAGSSRVRPQAVAAS
jgi:hypothetical protein